MKLIIRVAGFVIIVVTVPVGFIFSFICAGFALGFAAGQRLMSTKPDANEAATR